ncbi:hypothetical protein H0H81_002624 [Sphagnurus paluster]|uniref:5-formyltetrahydrofolate cyclo-ligase n=1 Tax=Sphagnurus paluster TaxID=117069 RepID=A0A9P7KN34_9AGAR|nr:hypothetical protein H0H81_002624 [Sphagnurus paluster]
MPSGEVDTSSLQSEILARGKSLFVPKITSKHGDMDFLKVYGVEDLDSFPSGLWGIREPDDKWQGSPRQAGRKIFLFHPSSDTLLDIILVPGVAFDKSFSRLGHGKGYYDRFIASYSANGKPRPLLVALSLREQILEAGAVPVDEHDWKMDLIVTSDAVLRR